MHAEALEYLGECKLYDGDRTGAESLFGQAVALCLVDGQVESAQRVAQQILPDPPQRQDSSQLRQPTLWTGQYL